MDIRKSALPQGCCVARLRAMTTHEYHPAGQRPPLSLLVLSDADIVALNIGAADVNDSVRAVFEAKANGRASTAQPLHFKVDAQLDFKAKGGALFDAGLAAVKWYGFAGGNAERHLPYFIPVIVLNSFPAGLPVALLDGHWISAVRTAAISAVAARTLARPDSSSVGFIAAGLQARSHLDALRAQFPIRRVVAYSRSGESARRFAEHARSLGLEASATTDPREAVEHHDIVVSSVPRSTDHAHFLDARRLAPGTFVAMADGGRVWSRESIGAFNVIATDDVDPVTGRSVEALDYEGPVAAELSQLIAGKHPVPTANALRGFAFAGSGLADVAVAALVYQRALAAGVGSRVDL